MLPLEFLNLAEAIIVCNRQFSIRGCLGLVPWLFGESSVISCGLDEVYALDSEFFSTWNENEPGKYQSHLVCWAWGKEGDLSCGKCLF